MLSQIPSSAQGLIFDLDGTLIDTMPTHYRACQEVCQRYNFEFPIDFFYAKAGIPTNEVFQMLVNDLKLNYDGYELGKEKEARFHELISNVTPIPEVMEIVINYYKKLPMTIGTGGQKDTVLKTLEITKTAQYFDDIVTKNDVSHHKPHPETFLKCSELMEVSPKHCVVFEDGDLGIEAAKEAGMHWIDVRKYIS